MSQSFSWQEAPFRRAEDSDTPHMRLPSQFLNSIGAFHRIGRQIVLRWFAKDYILIMQRQRGMKIGIWVTILGILVIIIGAAMYMVDYHRTIGSIGAIVGLVILVVGVAWWTWKDRTAPKTTAAQPSQPSQPAKAT